mgnify:CR=1 FL=1|tara:strand:+ start:724 stop:921 length:198 start_codon:yes stop_codon:yes gene_type:complete
MILAIWLFTCNILVMEDDIEESKELLVKGLTGIGSIVALLLLSAAIDPVIYKLKQKTDEEKNEET